MDIHAFPLLSIGLSHAPFQDKRTSDIKLINGFTKTRMQLWVRACIYQLWCFRMLATFLAPRFGYLLPQMVFYCILLRPARATQRKPSDSQTVIKGIDLGTRVVKCQVRAKRSSRESRVVKWEPKGCPRDPKQSQRIPKEIQMGYQSGSKNMISRKRHQRRIPQNRKVEKCKK